MSRLTCLDKPPRPDKTRVAPHNFRRLRRGVLIANDSGRHAWLSEEEYRQYLRGIPEGHPLWTRLQPKGFLGHSYDFDAEAVGLAETSFLSWRGPALHRVFIDRGGVAMGLDTARRVIDFIFSAPGRLAVEIVAEAPREFWPVIWFLAGYASRKSEWAKRPLSLTLTARGSPGSEGLEFLRGHGVRFRLLMDLDGAPSPRLRPSFSARRALCRIGGDSREPAAWTDWLAAQGIDSVRFAPAFLRPDDDGVDRFLEFYRAAVERMARLPEGPSMREEWAAAFLSRRTWSLPGADVLGELAYDPSGRVYTSEAGLALGEEGTGLFDLGSAETLRYQDLGRSEAVKACLASFQADNQPLCSQCAYKPHCALPPAANYAVQGTVWGRTPSSPLCRLHMGILDFLFERLEDERFSAWARSALVDAGESI